MPSLLLNYIMVVLRYSIDYQDPGFILDWHSIAIQYCNTKVLLVSLTTLVLDAER
jgi:hypothetical protein